MKSRSATGLPWLSSEVYFEAGIIDIVWSHKLLSGNHSLHNHSEGEEYPPFCLYGSCELSSLCEKWDLLPLIIIAQKFTEPKPVFIIHKHMSANAYIRKIAHNINGTKFIIIHERSEGFNLVDTRSEAKYT